MFSPLPNPAASETQEAAWARLIPGAAPAFDRNSLRSITRDTKKPMQSARPTTDDKLSTMPAADSRGWFSKALTFLLPKPLLSRKAWPWLRAVVADFTLVALNWLLIGATLVPLRQLFPHVRLFKYDAGAPGSFLGIALLHAALITLMGCTEGLYADRAGCRTNTHALGKSIFWATALMGTAYLMQGPWPTAGLVCGAGLLHFAAMFAWRRYIDRPPSDLRNVLIVGDGDIACRVTSYLEMHPEQGRAVYRFLSDDSNPVSHAPGRVSELARVARKGFIDEVIIASPRNRETAAQVLREAQRLRLDVTVVPDLFGYRHATTEVEHFGTLPLISLHAEEVPIAALVLKRWMDVAGAAAGLILLSPLMASIAACIKLDSSGPVIYRAQRAGRKGQLFRCYKFRTMVSDADERKTDLRQTNQRTGPFFKLAHDPRVTRVGRFLRRYSLDELPQFWNVLKGEMSLVGPRPHPVDDFVGYNIEHLGRLDVTPGMTGLWQVTARRDPSFERGIDLDREYIRTWSLSRDLQILLRTIVAVVRGSGQ